MKSKEVLNYKPCRVTECFQDLNGEIEVVNESGLVRLKGAGHMVWNMSNGNNTIENIVDTICSKKTFNRDVVIDKVCKMLMELNKRSLIVINWDPLYKFDLCQEVV